MPFLTALSAPQLILLRSDATYDPHWAADQVICLCPNTLVFAARVNGAVTGGPFAQFAFDTVTTGAYTDIQVGQRIVISPTNDIRNRDAWTGRVRKTPTSAIVYINETGVDLPDNAYVFVVDDYPLLDRLARPTSPTSQLKDYDVTFQRLAPVVMGVNSVYVGNVNGSGVLRIVLNASNSYVSDNSAPTITGYAWTPKSGTYTVISGGLTSSAVTLDVTEGHQWIKLRLTQSDGITWDYHFEVHACGTTYTPVQGFLGAQIGGNLHDGFNANVAAFTGVSNILDNTRITIWRSREYYTSTSGPLISGGVVDFVGYLSMETNRGQGDAAASYVSDSTFEVVGIGQRIAQLEMQLLALVRDTTPTAYDQIESLMPWRAVVHVLQRHSTLLNLFPLEFDLSVKNASFSAPYIGTVSGGALNAVNDILMSINAALEIAFDGRLFITRDLRFQDSTAQTAAINIANFDSRDMMGINERHRHLPPVGKVYCDGAYFDGNTLTAVRSIAPGTAQDAGPDSNNLSKQILTVTAIQSVGQAENNQRAANFLAVLNDDGNELTVTMPDGYFACLIPSMGYTYTWTLNTTSNLRGVSFTTATRWILREVTYTHSNETGGRDVTAKFVRLLPIPAPGDTVPIVTDNEQNPDLPPITLPAFDFELPETTFPDVGLDSTQFVPQMAKLPKGKVALPTGQTVLGWSDDDLRLITNFITLQIPTSRSITPELLNDYVQQSAIFDPLNRGSNAPGANNRIYDLANDGTDSVVFSTLNCYAATPLWLQSDPLDGLFTLLRAAGAPGKLAVYGPATVDPTGWKHTFDFRVFQDNWVANTRFASPGATYGTQQWDSVTSGSDKVTQIKIAVGSATTITSVRIVGNAGAIRNSGSRGIGDGTTIWNGNSSDINGSGAMDFTVEQSIVNPSVLEVFLDSLGTGAANYIQKVVVEGVGSDPFTAYWSKFWDFTVSPDGFNAEHGLWVAGQGWQSVDFVGGPTGHEPERAVVLISATQLPVCQIKYEYEFLGGYTAGAGCAGHTLTITRRYPPTPDTATAYCIADGIGTFGFDQFVNYPEVALTSDIFGSFANDYSHFTGHAHIRSAAIYGTGTNPFPEEVTKTLVSVSTDYGINWDTPLIVGAGIEDSVGGFDAQRAGDNLFAASNGAVKRSTTIGGAFTTYYTPTGGAQAVCIIVPWYNYAGVDQTSASNPDIIVALNTLDGSSRSLLWIEGGATAGTVHDITPVASMVFDNANCITTSLSTHIAAFGLVSGVYKLYVSENTGAAWTLRYTLTAPTFIRSRRLDNRAATGGDHGQLFLSHDTHIDYSSLWAATGPWPRSIGVDMNGIDILG